MAIYKSKREKLMFLFTLIATFNLMTLTAFAGGGFLNLGETVAKPVMTNVMWFGFMITAVLALGVFTTTKSGVKTFMTVLFGAAVSVIATSPEILQSIGDQLKSLIA